MPGLKLRTSKSSRRYSKETSESVSPRFGGVFHYLNTDMANETNYNGLFANKFCFILGCMGAYPLWVQKTNLPGIAGGASIEKSTRLRSTKYPGHGVNFSNLSMTIQVSEDLTEWIYLQRWINAIHLGSTLNDLKDWLDADTMKLFQHEATIGGSTTGTLVIHTNADNPNIKVIFGYLYPISLSDIELSTNQGTTERTATVEFVFNHIKYEKAIPNIDPIYQNPKVLEWLEVQRQLRTGQEVFPKA